ncbi:MAG: hypothetical protein KAF91_00275 [Nostoc sp. TH1S01]|nr:hypothetical protein [Nostoc sp. TH1S01]
MMPAAGCAYTLLFYCYRSDRTHKNTTSDRINFSSTKVINVGWVEVRNPT